MEQLLSFYKNQIAVHKQQLAEVKKQLLLSSILRLVVFSAMAFGVYMTFGNVKLVMGIVLGGIALFLFLVSKHTDLRYKKDKIEAILKINATEILVLERKFHDLPNGQEFADSEHFFSQDIDLFGKGSFYQYCNRTTLKQGSETLATLFLANTLTAIPSKQEAIEELAGIPEWRQEFSAIASLVKTETPYHSIIKWLQTYTTFVPKVMKLLPTLFSVISLVLVGGYFSAFLPGWPVLIWFLLGLGITGLYFKSITKLAMDTSKVHSTFQQYQKLIVEIEGIAFKASLLSDKKNNVMDGKGKTSERLKEFSRILNALDQRNNMLFGFLGNAFLLWDLHQAFKIEAWIMKYRSAVPQWFKTIAFFDAYNSLGNFKFNHPEYRFPTISEEANIVLDAKAAAHPLLDPKKAVYNDILINADQFFIITGANMAGKSTFLRTVSLQIVMANMGLPICAEKAIYKPIKLITSMRTTDSLTDDESYFFSELKRLKFIVDEIQHDRYFIVLDEILKGTNSTDKAIGSRKFVEKLVGSGATGIIATHDLSLCEAADEIAQIENHYFDAEIIDDELHFDYKFKKGICQNMNASFLLKKMEIV
ncbi:MutS-related protein [Spongiimicrobium salis]|uniref:MutS-related protein n=1 Tax=Spongiimicrobium salis TaxID=1667022 RepID=UPI00374D729C